MVSRCRQATKECHVALCWKTTSSDHHHWLAASNSPRPCAAQATDHQQRTWHPGEWHQVYHHSAHFNPVSGCIIVYQSTLKVPASTSYCTSPQKRYQRALATVPVHTEGTRASSYCTSPQPKVPECISWGTNPLKVPEHPATAPVHSQGYQSASVEAPVHSKRYQSWPSAPHVAEHLYIHDLQFSQLRAIAERTPGQPSDLMNSDCVCVWMRYIAISGFVKVIFIK